MRKFSPLVINLIILGSLLFIYQPATAQEWRPVRGGINFGISGIALLRQKDNNLDFLIVHDNKQKNQVRLAIIHIDGENQPEYIPLNWPEKTVLPDDLEALTSLPSKNNSEFLALTSDGHIYHLQLDDQKQKIIFVKKFELPKIIRGSNFEALSVENIDGKMIIVWAHRGEGKEPAKIYWGILDIDKSQINLVGSGDFTVPFPSGEVRHISDLKIDKAGIIYISAASDGGNDGPFSSAVYVAGYLTVNGNQIFWKQNQQLFPIYRDKYHKIEALEFIPGATGGIIVATDDENMGGYVDFIGK
ncbi:MAG: hypothetical protein ACKO3K_18475 [Cuspidothrix sp.]